MHCLYFSFLHMLYSFPPGALFKEKDNTQIISALKKSSARELILMALLDASSLLHFGFTLAILSCILPFRSSPLALACAAADLYFSSLCCNASSTVFGCCREAWNRTDKEMPHDSDFKTYQLPSSSPSSPSAETKTSLQSLNRNTILLKKVY